MPSFYCALQPQMWPDCKVLDFYAFKSGTWLLWKRALIKYSHSSLMKKSRFVFLIYCIFYWKTEGFSLAVSPVLPSGRMQNIDRLTRSGSEKKLLISMFQDWRELQNPASGNGGRTLMKLSSNISASITAALIMLKGVYFTLVKNFHFCSVHWVTNVFSLHLLSI